MDDLTTRTMKQISQGVFQGWIFTRRLRFTEKTIVAVKNMRDGRKNDMEQLAETMAFLQFESSHIHHYKVIGPCVVDSDETDYEEDDDDEGIAGQGSALWNSSQKTPYLSQATLDLLSNLTPLSIPATPINKIHSWALSQMTPETRNMYGNTQEEQEFDDIILNFKDVQL